MDGVLDLNLIHLFTFYLAAAFLVSTVRRLRQYHDVAQLVLAAPNRWPRVMAQIKGHWIMFLTWATLRPAVVALGLLFVQMVCSRLIWPSANLSLRDLFDEWWILPPVLLAMTAMLAVDLYGMVVVGEVDRALMEKYFDQAEFWLRSRTATVVRVFTLGYINPRRLVAAEVQKALVEASRLLNTTLWWMAVQVGLRIGFGLSLWVTWALTRG